MSKRPLPKTIHYLRARLSAQPFNLQELAASIGLFSGGPGATEVKFDQVEVVRTENTDINESHILVHLSRYVPGTKAETLEPKAKASNSNQGGHPPPAGQEYKDGDCFLLISEHHILYCGHRISLAKARRYISRRIHAIQKNEEYSALEISAVPNLDKLRLLEEAGVRSIKIGAHAYAASIEELEDARSKTGLVKSLIETLNAFIKEDPGQDAQNSLADLMVNVEFRLKGNTRASRSSKRLILEAANKITDEFDTEDQDISTFTIITQDGHEIRPSTVRLNSTTKIKAKNNSICHMDAWKQMLKYFRHLINKSLLAT